MFDTLQERLNTGLKRLTGRGVVRAQDLEEALAEIRTALLEADAALPTVRELLGKVEERALGAEVLESLTPGQQVVRIVFEELVRVLGGDEPPPSFATAPAPAIVMTLGLQGSGKTTTTAKLARLLAKTDGRSALVASLDVRRAAAREQLQRLVEDAARSDNLPIEFFTSSEQASPLVIAEEALSAARRGGVDLLFLDTAGRTTLDAEMMEEATLLARRFAPAETLLVADAMTGQDALATARAFGEAVTLSGVILTRADGDARGGAALSFRHATGQPIRFLGTGEQTDALEAFDPDRIARRILGFGDMLALAEAAEVAAENRDAEREERTARRAMKGKFDLDDLRGQLEKLADGGMLARLAEALPRHMRKAASAATPPPEELRRQLAILSSMTSEERRKPEILQASRRRRIALGAGVRVTDVNVLLKRHRDMKTLFKRFRNGGESALTDALGGGAGANANADAVRQALARRR